MNVVWLSTALCNLDETATYIVPGLPFILPHRVQQRRIEILRVLHASRRWPERLP